MLLSNVLERKHQVTEWPEGHGCYLRPYSQKHCLWC